MITKTLFYLGVYLFSISKRLINWCEVRILRHHLKYEILQTSNLVNSGKFVIIAVYAGTGTLNSLRTQVQLFADNKYNILVVLNANLKSANWVRELAESKCTIMLRPNLGADFGAYKAAVNYLKNENQTQISELVIANDSIFYTPESSIGLKSFFEDNNSINCLFFHKQSVRHAASVLIKFDTSVLKNKSFWDFWQGYYPYCVKNQIVRKGEHALTKIVGVDYFKPLVNLDSLNQFTERLESSEIGQAEIWSKRSNSFFFELIQSAIKKRDHRRIIEISISNLQVSNSLGLWSSRNLKVPVKLDLPQNGLCTISDLLRIVTLQGCNKEELAELQKVLEGRKTVTEGNYFDNILKFKTLFKN